MPNKIGSIKSYKAGTVTVANIYDGKLSPSGTKVLMHFDSSTTADDCGNSWTISGSPQILSSVNIGKSIQFNGSSCIVANDQTAFNLPTTFTLDAWIYPTQWRSNSYNSYSFPIFSRWNHGGYTLYLTFIEQGQIQYYSTSGKLISSSNVVPLNKWSHIATTRDSSNTIRLFYNGTLVGTGTDSASLSNSGTAMTIGASTNKVAYSIGYISEWRVSHTCRWTSNFTPPSFLTVDSYTKSLLRFDESTTKDECGTTWTTSGSPALADNSHTSVVAKFGKMLYLNGSSYLQMNGGITLGGRDFTIDGWCYISSSTGWWGRVFEFNEVAASSNRILLARYINSSAVGAGVGDYIGNSGASLDAWHHFAFTYIHDKNLVTLYMDGVATNTWTCHYNSTTFAFACLGKSSYSNDGMFVGYIDEFRITDGAALWTTNFTPPTSTATKQTGANIDANLPIRHNNTTCYIPLTTTKANTTTPCLVTRHSGKNFYALK